MQTLGVVRGVRHTHRTRHPRHPDRGVMVHLLMEGTGMLEGVGEVGILDEDESAELIEEYHDMNYVTDLREGGEEEEEEEENVEIPETLAEILDEPVLRIESPREGSKLTGDCPRFHNIWNYVREVVGGSVGAARSLRNGEFLRAVHWEGGRHHAFQDTPQGFCYVADVVLAVNELLSKDIKKVLVIDIDAHHGDAVQQAFYRSDRVFTLSFHMHGPGIYPVGGGMPDTGKSVGSMHNLNVPLHTGCDDSLYHYTFRRIAEGVKMCFKPDAVVVVCGADCLQGDPVGELNLSVPCMLQCMSYVRNWNLPTLLLGGGGYDDLLTARYWTALVDLMKQPGSNSGLFDPFDSSAPVPTSSEVRCLGEAHLTLPRIIPPDDIPDHVYVKFDPFTVLPPPPVVKRENLNTADGLRYLIHVALDMVLRVGL
eukprot:TRINITY_DN2479_c0_g2_i1.p1 TRINITY_DN2479_c0_g2~~TRINITY_DN2479_c0_g2_i1.p1  ORF type:complete len:440 (+),score=67.12 TRINITY_DN2479_c0_g2_i1:46-1320(+)